MATSGRAVIYCRISDDREGEAVGVERQEVDCRELAARLKLEVVDVKIDNDVGASTRTKKTKIRHEYEEMLRKARAGAYTHILAYSNSRITRRPLELEALIVLYEETGILINTVVSGNDDLSTADGRMVARIKASVDAAEAERISERIKAANRHKALKGEPGLQRRRPFGFEKDAKTHNPKEAAAMREAVAEILMGASITSIRRKWEREGILTTDGNPKWGWSPVHRVLFGWRAVGVRELNGEPLVVDGQYVKAAWKPIITMEDREAALEMLEKRTRKGKRQGKWLLQGLIYCGLCNRPLYGALDKVETSNAYTCTGGESTHLGVNAGMIEKYLRRVVYRYILEKTIRVDADPDDPRAQVWPDEEKLESVSRRISELMDAYNAEILSGSIVFPQGETLEQERKQLAKERTAFHAQQRKAPRLITTREDAWKRYRRMYEQSFEDTQLAFQQEIEKVLVGPGVRGRGGRTYSTFRKRVTIHWREPHYEFDGKTAEEWADQPIRRVAVADDLPYGAPLTEEEQARYDALEQLNSSLPSGTTY